MKKKPKTVYLTGDDVGRVKGLKKMLEARGHKVVMRPNNYYKKSRSQPRRSPRGSSRAEVDNMARRKRKGSVRYVTRIKKSYRKRSSGSFNIKNLLVPIGVATIAEPIIDRYAAMLPVPKIANLETDDMVKVAIGWYLGKKGGVMGNTAKMLGIFGLRNLISQGLGNILSGQATTDPYAVSQGF